MNLFRSEEAARAWPHLAPRTENQIMPVTKWAELLNSANIITQRLEPDFVANSEAWVGELLGKVAESCGRS